PGVFGVLFHLPWFSPHFIGFTFGLSLSAVSIFLFISPDILYGFIPEKKFSMQTVSEPHAEQQQPIIPSRPPIEEQTLAELPKSITDIQQTAESDEEIAAEAKIVV